MALQRLTPDLSLLANWNEQSEKSSSRHPYTAFYTSPTGELAYVGAHHGSGIDHPTFKQVEKTFHAFKPDVVIVEGTSGHNTPEALQFLGRAQQEAQRGFANAPEGQFAAWLAQQNGIPFIGGEPSRTQTLQHLISRGFTADDMIGYNMVLAIRSGAQAKAHPLTEQNATERLPQWLEAFAHQYGTSPAFGHAAFKSWYRQNTNEEFSVANACRQELFPKGRTAVTHLEKISDAQDLREPSILGTSFDQLNNNRRVMVVYGLTHQVKHNPVICAALDTKPRIDTFKL